MRKAMICVSVMLAILQIWPMMFGHDANQAIAAEPISVVAPSRAAVKNQVALKHAAVKQVAVKNVAALPVPEVTVGESRAAIPAMESCLRIYRRTLNACRAGDMACRAKVSDRWQVCEATGF